jgi:hypothetical protein
MTDLSKLVRPLVIDRAFFFIHASGEIEFFHRHDDAHDAAWRLGRNFHEYDAETIARYGARLTTAFDEWKREEQVCHTARIIAALDPDAVASMLADADERARKAEREACAEIDRFRAALDRIAKMRVDPEMKTRGIQLFKIARKVAIDAIRARGEGGEA